MSNQTFQALKELPDPLDQHQCVLHKHELLICGVNLREIYPSDIELFEHCVVKLVDNYYNKDNNQTNLLSFGSSYNGENKHTLVMKYVSVWSNDNNDNEINKLNNYNEWTPLQTVTIIQLSLEDIKKQHLLFITCSYNNIKNGQGQEIMKTNRQNYQMLLFCEKTGLSIEYNEDNNSFQFHELPVCLNIYKKIIFQQRKSYKTFFCKK
ncbi:hypothetical protein RFI_03201 [Reticulomyxa filosa]|uniref:Uncharacterized protein n=1 Tax=Reticulomyxa filosa TaxID=46433 RepID=X6P5W6_RETFI|nr:hypothetical protein RFI_03201 [Reticulomyxa filosa]|eukprot:ETO33895.1 hypothetical protein RFI_03201 [Reticulomyxa filosa]